MGNSSLHNDFSTSVHQEPKSPIKITIGFIERATEVCFTTCPVWGVPTFFRTQSPNKKGFSKTPRSVLFLSPHMEHLYIYIYYTYNDYNDPSSTAPVYYSKYLKRRYVDVYNQIVGGQRFDQLVGAPGIGTRRCCCSPTAALEPRHTGRPRRRKAHLIDPEHA